MSDNIAVTPGSGASVATHDLSVDGGSGHAQKMAAFPLRYTVTGHAFAVTVSTSVVKNGAGLTIPSNTTHMLISIEAGDVRFNEDSTAPTVAHGVLLTAGTLLEIPIPGTSANLQFIRADTLAVDATVNISYRQYI